DSQQPTAATRRFRVHMNTQGLLITIIVGLIAGFLAGKVMRGRGYGVLGDIIIGIIGAILGGWIFGVLGISLGLGILGSIIVAFIGAVVLIFLLRLIKRV